MECPTECMIVWLVLPEACCCYVCGCVCSIYSCCWCHRGTLVKADGSKQSGLWKNGNFVGTFTRLRFRFDCCDTQVIWFPTARLVFGVTEVDALLLHVCLNECAVIMRVFQVRSNLLPRWSFAATCRVHFKPCQAAQKQCVMNGGCPCRMRIRHTWRANRTLVWNISCNFL